MVLSELQRPLLKLRHTRTELPLKAVKLIQAENCSEVHDGDLQREISQVYVGLGL